MLKSKTGFPNLRAEMSRFKIDEEAIAGLMECDPKTVGNWVDGKTEPSYSQALAIRDEFFPGMSIEYLFSSTPLDVSVAS